MKTILTDWLAFFKAHTELFQFGQSHDISTWNGSTGCTHCFVQSMYLALTGKFLSHDEISSLCGYPWPAQNKNKRGMRASSSPKEELNTCVRRLGLPMEVLFFSEMTDDVWRFICERNNLGPVGAAVEYSWLPRAKAKGPGLNGVAEIGGATQIGLTGGHLDIRIGYDLLTDKHGSDVKPVARWHDYWHDPDHGSPARKEKPPYDRFLSSQGRVAIESIQRIKVLVNGVWQPRSIMVVVPTKPFSPR